MTLICLTIMYQTPGANGNGETSKVKKVEGTEGVDENGVKYIIYEENSVEINENAEVNIIFINWFRLKNLIDTIGVKMFYDKPKFGY